MTIFLLCVCGDGRWLPVRMRVLPPRAQTPALIAETGQTAGVGWSTLQYG